MVILKAVVIAVLGSCLMHSQALSFPDANNPCSPSPCGANAVCKINRDDAAICECLPHHVDAPPNCQPECIMNSNCTTQMACINLRCRDPCTGVCGLNAVCQTTNHSPFCSCSEGHTGDPFRMCTPVPQGTPASDTKNSSDCVENLDCPNIMACINKRCSDPCPGACGLKATCFGINHRPICSCGEGLTGDAFTECTPIAGIAATSTANVSTGCSIHEDCPDHLKCFNQQCHDPCHEFGLCGLNASCQVDNHIPTCKCPQGHQGNPFIQCTPIPSSTPAPSTPAADVVTDPCVPFPCGPNARCNNGVCTNITDYIGVPFESCVLECVLSSDCPLKHACLQRKCSDPCPGTCGDNSKCSVVNHTPVCTCLKGYRGDPFLGCGQIVERAAYSENIPCSPSPCGPNSRCQNTNGTPLCSCLKGFVGRPPSCQAECKLSTDCLQTKACVAQECVDPCQGACGKGAHCEVINHGAICSCRAGQSGDPCRSCSDMPSLDSRRDPCVPSPCGANALCKTIGDKPTCSCHPSFFGAPPNCRPECVVNTDCPKQLACISQSCRDPCPGTCGTNATCLTPNHIPICSCKDGHNGDPFFQCRLISDSTTASVPTDSSACVLNIDCPSAKACQRSKCSDPCPGVCGDNAKCSVVDHVPVCKCPDGYNGDPFVACRKVVERSAYSVIDPCVPSPCGPNSQCRKINDNAVCACLKGFEGAPPSCRSVACALSRDCPPEKACINLKCGDPCLGTCGPGATCVVDKHNPICSCPEGKTGDPFRKCQ